MDYSQSSSWTMKLSQISNFNANTFASGVVVKRYYFRSIVVSNTVSRPVMNESDSVSSAKIKKYKFKLRF